MVYELAETHAAHLHPSNCIQLGGTTQTTSRVYFPIITVSRALKADLFKNKKLNVNGEKRD
jgi:hypothetical protein